jgi:hypothetical protein
MRMQNRKERASEKLAMAIATPAAEGDIAVASTSHPAM